MRLVSLRLAAARRWVSLAASFAVFGRLARRSRCHCAMTARCTSCPPRVDLPAEQAAFMADSQVPWGVDALGGSITEPAWRIEPSWYLVATEDRMIPPPAQRVMSERAGSIVVEVSGSHAIYLSQPAAVAALIEQAAATLPAPQ
ncbi:MAG TPA: alpha/beta fold hydrolase [Jiangellaceae bacterium]|nr:alpha/beta fold hydrolase [Jiangellaceae bacterium]